METDRNGRCPCGDLMSEMFQLAAHWSQLGARTPPPRLIPRPLTKVPVTVPTGVPVEIIAEIPATVHADASLEAIKEERPEDMLEVVLTERGGGAYGVGPACCLRVEWSTPLHLSGQEAGERYLFLFL